MHTLRHVGFPVRPSVRLICYLYQRIFGAEINVPVNVQYKRSVIDLKVEPKQTTKLPGTGGTLLQRRARPRQTAADKCSDAFGVCWGWDVGFQPQPGIVNDHRTSKSASKIILQIDQYLTKLRTWATDDSLVAICKAQPSVPLSFVPAMSPESTKQ